MNNHRSQCRCIRLNAAAACVLAVFGTPVLEASAHATGFDAEAPRLTRVRHLNVRPAREAFNLRFRTPDVPAPKTRAAATILLSTCAESGPGSLRDALASAVDGDTVDLTDLRSCTITLESGALTTSAAVTILGPGETDLIIDGAGADRVLYGLGASLAVSAMTLKNGYAPDSGGCLAAAGNVTLDHVTVTGCRAGSGTAQHAYGGGIRVAGDLTVESSTISDNTAEATDRAAGGGLVSLQTLSLVDSVISDNHVSAARAFGGGVAGASYSVPIFLGRCVLERNVASGFDESYGGGVYGANEARLEDTRLTQNSASAKTVAGGGGAAAALKMTVAYDSVVANNTSIATLYTGDPIPHGAYGGGLMARFGSVYVTGDPAFGSGTRHPLIAGNEATSTNGYASGGALATRYIGGNIEVSFATVSGNAITSNGSAVGGGIGAIRNLVLHASTLSGNTVRSDCTGTCFVAGGGGYSLESVYASYSTVSDNHVVAYQSGVFSVDAGGLGAALYTLSVVESTVSGNTVSAPGDSLYGSYGGGLLGPRYSDSITVIRNSTIAFNVAGTKGGGVSVSPNAVPAELTSSIVSNSQAALGADIDVSPFDAGDVVLGGDHDLIVAPGAAITVPADTLTSDPRLLPLAGNGGGTPTHELAECSPANDTGSNPGLFEFDQRLAPYVRVSGAAADIGAFELQPDPDRIFSDSFELALCP